MFRKIVAAIFILFFCNTQLSAQYNAPLYTSYTTDAARARMKDGLIKNSIEKNFQLPRSDSTEENWEEAFDAMEVMNYNTPFTETKVHHAFDSIGIRSVSFQQALMEMAYSNYHGKFLLQAKKLLISKTNDPKIFAMCAEYLIQTNKTDSLKKSISKILLKEFGDTAYKNPILYMLQTRLSPDKFHSITQEKILAEILSKNFLPNQIVMYSLQRKDRDYPGLVLIRNANGDFVTDSTGNIFNIPQLARSISGLPGYLSNGNTPQGIFRMYGFDVSMGNFIGPTPNIQMGMPVELSLQKFFDNNYITDSTWTIDYYQKLIPKNLKDFFPLYESYYAGLAGRSEIIAHGTTIDPSFYSGKPYYPLTPTQGCLCTKEIWNGKRIESDQEKLVNGLLKAGGANGYCVVIEIDNKKAPVKLKDVMAFLPK